MVGILRVNALLADSMLESAGLKDRSGELSRTLRSRPRAASDLLVLLRELLMVFCRRSKAICKEVLRLIDSVWPGFNPCCP